MRYKIFIGETGEPVAYVDDIRDAVLLLTEGRAILDTRTDVLL